MIKIIKLERKSLEQFLDENNLTIEVIEDKSGQFRAKFIDFLVPELAQYTHLFNSIHELMRSVSFAMSDVTIEVYDSYYDKLIKCIKTPLLYVNGKYDQRSDHIWG